jgi:hypothetical protein
MGTVLGCGCETIFPLDQLKKAAALAAALNSLDLLFELTDAIYQNLSAL